jgi:hypothetical protein
MLSESRDPRQIKHCCRFAWFGVEAKAKIRKSANDLLEITLMKKAMTICAALGLVSAICGMARADVTWKGVTWAPDQNVGGESGQSSVVVNGSNLEVSTVTMAWANAYYTITPLTTNWVQATFVDSGAGAGACLSFDTVDDWTGIGINNAVSTTNYVMSWFNDNSSGDFILGARTAGTHTAMVGRRPDGTVDYWFDGSLVQSIDDFFPARPMTHVFLGVDAYFGSRFSSGGAVAVYTDYQSGTNYVPEPATMILLGLGAWGMLRRNRRV